MGHHAPLTSGIVIADVRFENEAAAIQAAGGLVWGILRPGYEGDGHISEVQVSYLPVNVVVRNDRGLAELAATVEVAMSVSRLEIG